jgi:hypothetical protein
MVSYRVWLFLVNCIKGRVFLQPTLTGQSAQLHATKVIVSKGEYSYSLLWLVSLLNFMLQRENILTAYSDWSICSSSCYKGRIFLQLTLTGSKSVHVFYRLFIYVLPLEIQFSREQGCHLINCLTEPHFCACPKSGPGFPTSYMYVVVFFVISEFS